MAIEFDGLDEILTELEKAADADKVKAAMGKACALVERTAKQKAHTFRDTGTLTNSIKSEVEVRSGEISGVVFTNLEYAPYVEYGTGLFAEEGGRRTPWKYKDDEGHWHTTRGQKPQPFLRPAVNENRDKIIEVLKEGIKQ